MVFSNSLMYQSKNQISQDSTEQSFTNSRTRTHTGSNIDDKSVNFYYAFYEDRIGRVFNIADNKKGNQKQQ